MATRERKNNWKRNCWELHWKICINFNFCCNLSCVDIFSDIVCKFSSVLNNYEKSRFSLFFHFIHSLVCRSTKKHMILVPLLKLSAVFLQEQWTRPRQRFIKNHPKQFSALWKLCFSLFFMQFSCKISASFLKLNCLVASMWMCNPKKTEN
jgi:hypothetical protein